MTNSYSTKLQIQLPLFAIMLTVFVTISPAFGQTKDSTGKNNPYSPSPVGMAKEKEPPVTPEKSGTIEIAFITQNQNKPHTEDRPAVAQSTYKIAKNTNLRSLPLTEIYKVGVGDVLFVNLKNAAGGFGYYTVRQNGTIDFPLAGENIIVADQTVDKIEEMLASGITLFPDPQVEVKVREYGSHKITVSGSVEHGGEKNLQREAIPLYVIRAEAVVDSKATKVVITRAPLLKLESYNLRDANTDNILIYPGNAVEFKSEGSSSGNGFYYISGEIVSSGQKEIIMGLTLYQAVVASGGTKGNPKKAVIRRMNEKGIFSLIEYDLRAIKNGKAADPALALGDVIEIRN